MSYIAPIHRPSCVRHALRIRLLSPDQDSLVIAKANRIEIWHVADNAMTLLHSRVVFGTISILQRLQPKDSPTDLLFVGTDRFQYFSLEWNPETQQLETVDEFSDPGEKHLRDSQSQDKCLVDPTGRYMAMLLWEGVLTVLRLRDRKGTTKKLFFMDQIRLSEMFIKACTFLHSETGHPRVAFLYQTRSDASETKLSTYRLTADDRQITASRFDPQKDREMFVDIGASGATLLIPVEKVEEEKRHNVRNVAAAKPHLGGLLVVGESSLLYIDDVTERKVEASLKSPNVFVAWAKYDVTHYLLGDDYGFLHLLTILTEGVVVTGLDVTAIGKIPRPGCMVNMGDNMLYVGSHVGDSQLLRLNLNADGEPLYTTVQVLRNIGPILDFAVMDMGNREDDSPLGNEYSSGQARIVTASGAHKDGSLRSVRSGVGLEDIGILGDFSETRSLFSVRSHGSQRVDVLVASFLTETRIFQFDPTGGIEELDEFGSMSLGSQTLWAASLAGDRLLQITPGAVILVDTESGISVATWKPPEGKTITNASANARFALLSVEGTLLVSLDIEKDLAVSAQKDASESDQIACVHASPQLLDTGVVGLWSSGSISVVQLSTLDPLHGQSLRRKEDNASIPRDIALLQVLPPSRGGPTLFVAMDDGNVVTFNISKEDLALSGRKSVVLGTRQARFHVLPQSDGTCNIFAATAHPSLIYGSEGRIVYSAMTAENAACVCPFDAEAFPGAIAMATDSEIKISRVDTERRTHVQTLEMGETIRRIAYSPAEKMFGLGCIKRDFVRGREIVSSSFKLVDEVIFDNLGKPFELNKYGGSAEIVESVIRAELPDFLGRPAERFLVGTSFLADDSSGSADEGDVHGRIIVLGVNEDRSPYVVMSHHLKGACRCLAVMDDMVVAGLTKTVVLSRYTEASSTSGKLVRLSSYRASTYPVDLAIHGNIVAVADLMKSMSLVEVVREDGKPPQLVERARHFQSIWATAVSHVEDESWLEADAQGNLLVLRRNAKGVTREDQRRMEVTGEMSLGEMVNKIRKITVETSPGAMIIPRAFLATVEGSIYMYGTVAPSAQDLLMRFQARLERLVSAPGNIDFRQYRGFRNVEREAEGPFRFIDGELIERFLDAGEELQKEICEGLGPSVEDMRNVVEELKRLH